MPSVHTRPESKPRLEVASAPKFAVSIVSFLTLLVACCGYLREAALAARFGVSGTMDSYFASIFVPNILYWVLITGTLSPILISLLLEEKARGELGRLSEAFSNITNFVLLLLLVVVALALATARFWLRLLFSGFGADNIQLALNLSYIVFPGVIFLVIAGILTAVLNGFQRFGVASLAPALGSIAVFLTALFIRTKWAIYAVGFATSLGFLLQALVLVPAVKTLGVRYSLTVKIKDPVITRLLRLGIPLFLYLAVANATLFIERHFAAQLSAGAVSTLTYAMRLFTVPATLLATPLAVVAHPRMTRKALQDQDLLRLDISETLRLVFFLFFPITVWIVLNALPITRAVYERGLFTLQDSIVTSKVLALYGIGILPNAAAILLVRCFFVIADTITPLWTELIDLAVYSAAAIFLTRRFGIAGLAIARGTTFYLVAVILAFVLWKYRRLLVLKSDFIRFFIQATVATSLMGVFSWAAHRTLGHWFESGSLVARLEILGVNLLLSIAIFLIVSRALNVPEARNITGTLFAIFKRGRG